MNVLLILLGMLIVIPIVAVVIFVVVFSAYVLFWLVLALWPLIPGIAGCIYLWSQGRSDEGVLVLIASFVVALLWRALVFAPLNDRLYEWQTKRWVEKHPGGGGGDWRAGKTPTYDANGNITEWR